MDEVVPGAAATAVAPARAMSAAAWLPWVALALLALSRRHVGGTSAEIVASKTRSSDATFSRVDELGRFRRAGRDFTRRQVRRLRRRPRWPVRRLGRSAGHRRLQEPHGRLRPHIDVQEPPAKPGLQWRLGPRLWFSRTGNPRERRFSWRWPVRQPSTVPRRRQLHSRLVAGKRPARVHRARPRPATPCFSQTVPARNARSSRSES